MFWCTDLSLSLQTADGGAVFVCLWVLLLLLRIAKRLWVVFPRLKNICWKYVQLLIAHVGLTDNIYDLNIAMIYPSQYTISINML